MFDELINSFHWMIFTCIPCVYTQSNYVWSGIQSNSKRPVGRFIAIEWIKWSGVKNYRSTLHTLHMNADTSASADGTCIAIETRWVVTHFHLSDRNHLASDCTAKQTEHEITSAPARVHPNLHAAIRVCAVWKPMIMNGAHSANVCSKSCTVHIWPR